MFPVEFDHGVLDGLPLPAEEDAARVVHILRTIVGKRIIPFFRKERGTDPIVAARVADHLAINRLEDEENRIRCVSLVTRKNHEWTVHIHERIFDYLAFVIPSDPESTLGGATKQEGKILAFAEFMLRHQLEHMLYPERTAGEVIRSDVVFAKDKASNDPTFYRMLRDVLADEMNGLKGERYLALFDSAQQERSYDAEITRILDDYTDALTDVPGDLLEEAFLLLDREVKTKLLGLCGRKSRDTSKPLLERTGFLKKLLDLLALLIRGDEKEAEEVLEAGRAEWDPIFVIKELGVPEAALEEKNPQEIYELFKESLRRFSEETKSLGPKPGPAPVPVTEAPPVPTVKSLKDRIEEARDNPLIPRRVIEIIDKNKLNAVGHSGSKYSELIETLLLIPWGIIQKIEVTSEEFEQGLNRSHFGLDKPKELICDFFANLVWRYQNFREADAASWHRNGSAFLFVGPPGVGKTSLAISAATSLGIPYHKLSLGGMRDEADLRGHGFTYEGSKPGAIVQGLIKMGVMNGMFIMDEADKMEKFAVATLLEILDPEQNHLFHDRYTESTVDIDLSNCHFVLTANTLETVPPPVVNRCEVVLLDRYSVDEKISIARRHLIERVRNRYQISDDEIFFDPEKEADLLRFMIKNYTYEAGVRELERLIRTLFLRISRKEILRHEKHSVRITREKIKQYLEPPGPPRPINDEDRVGEMTGLGVNVELGVGSVVPIQATPIRIGGESEHGHGYLSMVHATGNIQKIMDESRTVATTAILHCARELGIGAHMAETPIHLHFMGGSTPKDGPSAGGAIALALASALTGRRIRRDVAMTGEIDTHGRITQVGGLDVKLETAGDAGCKTVIVPIGNLYGEDGIERLSDARKREIQILTYQEWKGDHEPFDYERHMLQVVAVEDVKQAADIAFIDDEDLTVLETLFVPHARSIARVLAKSRKEQMPCFRALFMKDPKELDLRDIEDPLWTDCRNVFLVRPDAKGEVLRKFPWLGEDSRLLDFDPATQTLTPLLQELDKSFQGYLSAAPRLSLVAPFFLLLQDGINLDTLCPEPSFEGMKLFANNYTAQGVKIKACKAVLNRVFSYLAQLDPTRLLDCPFLGTQEGIYVVDLSFIPEKYRLDVKRSEQILNKTLQKWVTEVEGYIQGM